MTNTITFKGKSEKILINGKFTHLVVESCTDRIVTPIINFEFLDGEIDSEPIETNFSYEVLYTVAVFFDGSFDHDCSITYRLS